ncbi:uncharacterized protein DMENIID0001_057360 [Sergentomyia squamirostris]
MIGKVLVFLWLFPNLWATIIQAVSSECHLCESLITKSDQCTFLLDESTEQPEWSCPLVLPCVQIISINYDILMNFQAIKIQKISKCNKFIINTSNVTRYAEIFNGEEKFAPYSVIILLMIEENEEPYVFHKDQTDYMYYNALHVVQFHQSSDQITISNVLTGARSHGTMQMIPHINSVLGILGSNKMHPLIDSEYSNEINISLAHFPPIIIDKYRDDLTVVKDNPTLDSRRFDGVEYRLMTHITKKWKRRFYMPGPEVLDPWAVAISDVSARRSNIAVCGYWLLKNISDDYDISQPYMQQCITFVVPRLPPIPRDQYIYLALQGNIWIFYTIIIVSIYSTGYTSIVTTLLFNKPINTVRDVIDKNLRWGDIEDIFKNILSESSDKEYIKLADLQIDSYSEEAETLFQSSNYAQVGTVLTNNWITEVDRFENASSKYSVMNTCFYKVYTVFVFSKNSPYLEYFNKEIPKYVESGLILHWFDVMNRLYGKRYFLDLFMDTNQMMQGPFIMTVADIAIGLYILGIGLVISTGVFIAELCCWRF